MSTSEGRTRLVLRGEFDAGYRPGQLQNAVLEAQRRAAPVEVDTSEVTFIDSYAFAELINLVLRAPHPVVFVRPPGLVRFMLDITGLHTAVHIEDSSPR